MKDYLFFENLRNDDKVIKDRVMQLYTNSDDSIEQTISYIKSGEEYKALARALALPNYDEKAAKEILEGFVARTMIIDYIGRQGYLSSSEYGFQTGPYISPIINDVSFYLNVSALLRKVDIRKDLNEYFKGYGYQSYIDELLNPKESCRCEVCGTYSYINKLYDDDSTLCIDCYSSNSEQAELMSKALKSGNLKRAISLRVQYDNGAFVPMAEGYSPYKIIREFMDSCSENEESYETKFCRATFDLFEESIGVVEHPKLGIIAFDFDNLIDYESFFSSVVLEPDGHTIKSVKDSGGAVMLGDNALKHAYFLIDMYRQDLS